MSYRQFVQLSILLLATIANPIYATGNGELPLPPASDTADPTATLIVSYHTGPKEDRLDRVRFRLHHPNGDVQLYPKSSNTTPLPHNQQRIVVIEGLTAGEYRLQFLIPNRDQLFDEVPTRVVVLNRGALHKVDQHIRPRYAGLKAQAHSSEGWPSGQQPTITLLTDYGEMRAQSTVGKLSVHYLLPGSYKLIFEPLAGYITPAAVELTIAPHASLGPIIATYHRLPTRQKLAATSKHPQKSCEKQ